ncbi:MAG: hypothetical protein ACYDAR_13020 [Thermomicrobiales bacterium]
MIAGLYTVWAICLVIAVVVILIAAALLIAILLIARSIAAHGLQALAAADAIAKDTQVIWALSTTNEVAGEILATAESIEAHGGRIAGVLHETQAIPEFGGQ